MTPARNEDRAEASWAGSGAPVSVQRADICCLAAEAARGARSRVLRRRGR